MVQLTGDIAPVFFDPARRALVLACSDVALLERWIALAAGARSVDEVFTNAG